MDHIRIREALRRVAERLLDRQLLDRIIRQVLGVECVSPRMVIALDRMPCRSWT
jgi:hypothetical protein